MRLHLSANRYHNLVQEVTPTATLPIPELLHIPTLSTPFLTISLLVLPFPILWLAFNPLVLWHLTILWCCLCKLLSFTFSESLPALLLFTRASGWWLLFTDRVSPASEISISWQSVGPSDSGRLAVLTDSTPETSWLFPDLESNWDLEAAPLAGVVDFCCILAALALENMAWEKQRNWLYFHPTCHVGCTKSKRGKKKRNNLFEAEKKMISTLGIN